MPLSPSATHGCQLLPAPPVFFWALVQVSSTDHPTSRDSCNFKCALCISLALSSGWPGHSSLAGHFPLWSYTLFGSSRGCLLEASTDIPTSRYRHSLTGQLSRSCFVPPRCHHRTFVHDFWLCASYLCPRWLCSWLLALHSRKQPFVLHALVSRGLGFPHPPFPLACPYICLVSLSWSLFFRVYW